VCSNHGFEVVLTTRRNFFFGGYRAVVIDCIIEFNTNSTRKYS